MILAALCITFCCLCLPLREKPGNVPSNLPWDTASLAVSQGSVAASGAEQIHDSQHKHQTQLAAHLGCNSRLYLHLFSQGDSVRVRGTWDARTRRSEPLLGKRFREPQPKGWFPLNKIIAKHQKYQSKESTGASPNSNGAFSAEWLWLHFEQSYSVGTPAHFWWALFIRLHSKDLWLESGGNRWSEPHFLKVTL